jgi:hypothetical protein
VGEPRPEVQEQGRKAGAGRHRRRACRTRHTAAALSCVICICRRFNAWRLELEKTDRGEFWKTIKRNNDSFAVIPGLTFLLWAFLRACTYVCVCVYGVEPLGSGGPCSLPLLPPSRAGPETAVQPLHYTRKCEMVVIDGHMPPGSCVIQKHDFLTPHEHEPSMRFRASASPSTTWG